MNLGNAIRLCRVRKNLTQNEFAKQAGISSNFLSLLEGEQRTPSFAVLKRIAWRLGIPLFLLFFLAENEQAVSAELAEKLFYEVFKALDT